MDLPQRAWTHSSTGDRERRSNQAFTRQDLLAVLVAVFALALVQVAGRGNTRVQSEATVCLSNFQQLIRAWQLYADDNNGRLVPSYHGADAAGANNRNVGWAKGWLDWTTGSDNTNTLLLIDDRYAKLGRYLGRDASVFACPSDRFLSANQKLRGWTRRVRNVSGNVGIGEGNAETGPWENIYKHIRSASDFVFPGPSETWVYLEEHPDSINDPAFFNPLATSWVDVPAALHNGATSFAFADGHAEIHLWQASLSIARYQSVTVGIFLPAPVRRGDPDVRWLSYRAGRVSTQTY